MIKKALLIIGLLTLTLVISAQERFVLKSPNGALAVEVETAKQIKYSVAHNDNVILSPSVIWMKFSDGEGFGFNSKLKKSKNRSVNQIIDSPFYKRSSIKDIYNELILTFKEDFNLVFRAYDDGVAYRFVSTAKKSFTVKDELAEFNFEEDFNTYIPYVDSKASDIKEQYFNSFENLYTYAPLSETVEDRLSFSPVVVELNGGKKVAITEADLENYPGMFLTKGKKRNSLKSHFAPYPAETEQGGHNNLQQLVTRRENYIATCEGVKSFPWRVLIVSTADKELADNDMIYKLAAERRIEDTSWIKPGKVAWEWWNHWGLYEVDFEAGINNETYMAYIDFASANGIEYVILDEGWTVKHKADLFDVIPQIDLKKLISYADSKGVGLILWAGYWAFDRDMEKVCKHYSELGIKGFKIDFMDRDDQYMVDFHYRAAATAAKYELLVNFHGTYKPTGLNRTYPNVINYEAVHGLEQMKWSGIEKDQVTYDVTMPFIRMLAGPIDYTQGAMRNATKRTYRGINDQPMSQGTRCRQLATYVIFESPLNMLCDSPTNYMKEPECTSFIAGIPTVWDNSVAIDGKIGEYIAMARQKEGVWYVGALTNWDSRTMELDLSFVGEGDFEVELFKDGANANHIASDFVKETISLSPDRKLTVSLAQGGGCAMKIEKKQNIK